MRSLFFFSFFFRLKTHRSFHWQISTRGPVENLKINLNLNPERQRVANVLAYLLAYTCESRLPGSHASTTDGARPNLKSAKRGRAFL